jgi:lauroyl/myristoyl acyltransferase
VTRATDDTSGWFSPRLAPPAGIAGRIRSLYQRWGILCGLHAIGFDAAARLAERAGEMLWRRAPAFSEPLRARIVGGLGEGDPQRLDAIGRAAAVHMCLNIVETEFTFRMIAASTFARRVRMVGVEPIIDALRRGRGVVAPGAYLGNHQAAVTAVAHLLRGNVAGIVTPRQYATQHRWMRGMAMRRLARFHSSAGAVRGSLRALRQGRLLTLIVEHPSRSRAAVRTRFLGRERAFHPTAALLARRARCPIAVVTCTRVSPMRFELRMHDWIEPPSTPAHDWIDATTRRIMATLDAEIRRTPGQYAWLRRADLVEDSSSGAAAYEAPE